MIEKLYLISTVVRVITIIKTIPVIDYYLFLHYIRIPSTIIAIIIDYYFFFYHSKKLTIKKLFLLYLLISSIWVIIHYYSIFYNFSPPVGIVFNDNPFIHDLRTSPIRIIINYNPIFDNFPSSIGVIFYYNFFIHDLRSAVRISVINDDFFFNNLGLTSEPIVSSKTIVIHWRRGLVWLRSIGLLLHRWWGWHPTGRRAVVIQRPVRFTNVSHYKFIY